MVLVDSTYGTRLPMEDGIEPLLVVCSKRCSSLHFGFDIYTADVTFSHVVSLSKKKQISPEVREKVGELGMVYIGTTSSRNAVLFGTFYRGLFGKVL